MCSATVWFVLQTSPYWWHSFRSSGRQHRFPEGLRGMCISLLRLWTQAQNVLSVVTEYVHAKSLVALALRNWCPKWVHLLMFERAVVVTGVKSDSLGQGNPVKQLFVHRVLICWMPLENSHYVCVVFIECKTGLYHAYLWDNCQLQVLYFVEAPSFAIQFKSCVGNLHVSQGTHVSLPYLSCLIKVLRNITNLLLLHLFSSCSFNTVHHM